MVLVEDAQALDGAAPGSVQRDRPVPSSSLAVGSTVRLGGHSFRIGRPLGVGSFGTVWEAVKDDGTLAAVKEILCKNEGELRRAAFERDILELLANESVAWHCADECTAASQVAADQVREAAIDTGEGRLISAVSQRHRRLPSLIAAEVFPAGEGHWRNWLAMTRVPGQPLSQLLAAKREERNAMGRAARQRQDQVELFLSACNFATELIAQLAPALERLGDIAYHRDITPRNILVDDRGDFGPCFGLVDFGLAVDSALWRSGSQIRDIGGDGHYWPTSAWLVFSHGAQGLSERPGLAEEYMTCLDIHSLGLAALQCLLELGPSLPHGASAAQREDLANALPQLQKLRAMWGRYCSDVRRFWHPIYKLFRDHTKTNYDSLKVAYAHAGVYELVSNDLVALKSAIRAVRSVCETEAKLAPATPLFDALLLMVQSGTFGQPPEACNNAADWQAVRLLLGRGRGLEASPASPTSTWAGSPCLPLQVPASFEAYNPAAMLRVLPREAIAHEVLQASFSTTSPLESPSLSTASSPTAEALLEHSPSSSPFHMKSYTGDTFYLGPWSPRVSVGGGVVQAVGEGVAWSMTPAPR